jgi:hypothetical protein
VGQLYISYSQSDATAAKHIRDTLQGWGHTVWLDDPDEEFDQQLAEQLDRALRECDVFIALLSPASVKSRTVRREIAIAKSLQKTVIPMVVQPMPNIAPDAKVIDATTNINAALSRLIKVIDARLAAEPLPPAVVLEPLSGSAVRPRQSPLVPLAIVLGIVVVGTIIVLLLRPATNPFPNAEDAQHLRETAAALQMTADSLATPTQPTPMPSATLESSLTTPVAKFGSSVGMTQYDLITVTQVANIPAGTRVRVGSMRYDGEEWIYTISTEGDQQFAEARESQLDYAPGVTPGAPTPTVAGPLPTDTPISSAGLPSATPTSGFPPANATIMTVTPSAQATATIDLLEAESLNLLTNPGFESFTDTSVGQVAQRWTAWSITQGANMPSYQLQPTYQPAAPASDRIHGGINAQQYFSTFATHDGGLYQQVSGVQSGAALRFSVYAYVWSSTFEDRGISEQDGDVTFQVGIDPTGGTDPQSANIVWSSPVKQYDAYHEYAVTATAASSTVTVFVRSKVDFPVANAHVYVDDGLLIPVSG